LTKKCWSIRQNGLVVAHSYEPLFLRNVSYVVNAKGREKVLLTKTKNVHAYVKGYIIENQPIAGFLKKAYYNPYNTETFVDFVTKEPLTKSSYCCMTDDFMVLYKD